MVRGYPASAGIGIGPARRFRTPDLAIPDGAAGAEDEMAALDAALGAVGDDIARQRALVAGRADGDEAEIFDAHLLFLRDGALLSPTRRAIVDDGVSAARAWHDVIERTAEDWDGLEDEYLRARAADLRSVGRQVLARLLDVPIPHPVLEAPGVVIASDLSPADTVGLDPAVVLGIATAAGGPTSHAAVLARASGIPAVVGAGDALLDLAEGTPIVVDGTTGVIHVDPDASLLAELTAARDERATALREAQVSALEPARTIDGATIEVAANIGSPADAVRAVAAGADGVGLFRTEFLFMGRSSMPDAREQEAAYRETAEALGGRPLVIRTLDAGADKPLPYLDQPSEPNPFLGVRGIRLGLDRPRSPTDATGSDPPRGRRPSAASDVPDGCHGRRAPRGQRSARTRRRTAADARSRRDGGGAVGRVAGGPPGGARGLLLDRHERSHPIHDGRGSRERSCERTGRRRPSRGASLDQDDRRGRGRPGAMGRGVR